mmetsp:Transcript_42388/g.112171  ORF Transcript_42388/g.112171 Transcript_42388/m.112171 type:complete len:311 (-) Transcript_42388:8-940(-)
MGQQGLRELLHLAGSDQALHEHLVQNLVVLECPDALVLAEDGQEARALRARRRQNGARDSAPQQLQQVGIADLPSEGLLGQVAVLRGGVQELSLAVQDARVADPVAERERLVVHLVHHHRRAGAEGVGSHGVVILEIQLCDLDVLLCLLQGSSTSRPRLEVDGRQTLRSFGPVALGLEDLAKELPDDEVLLLKGDDASSEPLQRVQTQLAQLVVFELVHLLSYLLQNGPREEGEGGLLGEHAVHQVLQLRDVVLSHQRPHKLGELLHPPAGICGGAHDPRQDLEDAAARHRGAASAQSFCSTRRACALRA